MEIVICQNKWPKGDICNWQHFQVSASYVRDWEEEWLKLFNEKDAEWLEMFGVTDKPPSTDIFTQCHRCGGSYKNFKDVTPEDEELIGCTITPILNREEDL